MWRSLRNLAVALVGGLVLAFTLVAPGSPARGQEAEDDPANLVPPAEWEVEEAVEVLRRYIAIKRAERAEQAADRQNLQELREQRVRPALQAIRQQLYREGQSVATADAPTLGDASITISEQIHLSDTSAVFKNDQLFLWDDTAGENLALGREALAANTSGGSNTAIGRRALLANTAGDNNTALGANSLSSNSIGFFNTAIGWSALVDNTIGSSNTAVGQSALFYNTTGYSNTALGVAALVFNTTGTDNVAIGSLAGSATPPDASDNILIGSFGDASDTTPTIRIGEDGTQTRAFVVGIDGTSVSGSTVQVTADGQLGVASSSRRFKEAIEELEPVVGRLLELRPVSFRYDPELVSGGGDPQVGLIAEEVAQLFPELVTRDELG